MKIKNNLRIYRKEAEKTQKELARLTNISERQIQRIENENQIPSGRNMLILAQFFNTTVEEIFELPSKNISD